MRYVQHGQSISQYEAVLSDLAVSMESPPQDLRLSQDQWSLFDADSFPAEDLLRHCVNGKLYVSVSEIDEASGHRAVRNLANLTGSQSFQATPFNKKEASSTCAAEETSHQLRIKKIRATVEAEASRQKRLNDLRLCKENDKYLGHEGNFHGLDKAGQQRLYQTCEDVRSGKRHDLGDEF